MNIAIKKNELVIVLYIIVMFLTTGSVVSICYGNIVNYVLLGSILLLFVYVHRSGIVLKVGNNWMFLIGVLMAALEILSDIYFHYSILYSGRFICVLVFSWIGTQIMTFDKFKKIYIKAMTVISGISLLGYFWGIFTNFYYPLSTIENINGVSYYNGYIFFAMNDYSRGRNIGIFWEPGIFAIFIAIAILFSIFDGHRINKSNAVVLFVALVTTYSTTGYALLLISIIALLCDRKTKNMAIIGFLLVGVVLVIIVYFGSIEDALMQYFPRVFSKLYNNSNSTIHRVNSIVYNLKIFIQNPLGHGLTRANVLFSEMTEGSQTSTMTLYIAQFGVLGGAFVLLQFISILVYKDWRMTSRIMFLLVWIIIFNVEIMTFFTAVYALMFYFMNCMQRDVRSIKRYQDVLKKNSVTL